MKRRTLKKIGRRVLAAFTIFKLWQIPAFAEDRDIDWSNVDAERFDELYSSVTTGEFPDGDYTIALFDDHDEGIANLTDLAASFGLVLTRAKVLSQMRDLWTGRSIDRAIGIVRLKGGLWRAPGKMYCGQSFADPRRESIILDWAHGEKLTGYARQFDWLTGRKGLSLRDEIRQFAPGVYLGRAYWGRRWLMNFVMRRESATSLASVSQPWIETCWAGSEAAQASK